MRNQREDGHSHLQRGTREILLIFLGAGIAAVLDWIMRPYMPFRPGLVRLLLVLVSVEQEKEPSHDERQTHSGNQGLDKACPAHVWCK